MRNLSNSILTSALVVLSAGCMSVGREAKWQRELLTRHPAHEVRMSDHMNEGYVSCGVWKIRGASNTLYLAATSHEISENQIPFPSPFYAAYQDSDEVFMEIDPKFSVVAKVQLAFRGLKMLKAHRNELFCAKNRNLGDYLSAVTVDQLKARYEEEYPKKARFTPLGLAFFEFEMAPPPETGHTGVEDPFALWARRDHKPLHALDNDSALDFGMKFFEIAINDLKLDIARRGPNAVIREKILSDNKDDLPDTVWRRGDLVRLEEENQKMKNASPSRYEMAIPERNRKWMESLKVALQRKRNVMVLVGAGHLSGKEGLLHLLQEAGFTAEQMYGADRPDADR